MHEHVSADYKEYQGCAVWKDAGRRYVAFTLFTQGIDIWDVTDAMSPRFIRNIALSEVCKGNKYIQTLVVKHHVHYLYATLAPMSQKYFKKEDVRGVVQVNVANMDSISFKAFYIPREGYWKSMPGDAHPKSLSVYEDKVYVSAATSGAAVFEMTDGGLKYIGLKEISSDWDQIYPIVVTKNGSLVSGDWNWNKIYVTKLK